MCAAIMLSAASCGSGGDPDVPSGMKLCSSADVDYYFYIPDQWIGDISTGVASAYYSQSDRSNVSMEAFELEDPNTSVPQFWESYSEDFKTTFSDMEYITEGESLIISDVAAYKYVYTTTVTGIEYQFMQIAAIKAGIVYIFTYTALPDKYESHIDEVDYMIGQIVIK